MKNLWSQSTPVAAATDFGLPGYFSSWYQYHLYRKC